MRRCACGCGARLVPRQKLFAGRACMIRAEGQSREKRTPPQRAHIERSKRQFTINPMPKDAGMPSCSWWLDRERFYERARVERTRMRTAKLGYVVTERIEGWT